jgi:5-methylcytosine-specific restriction endonuclease McrA
MPALIPRACRKRGCPGTTTDRSGYCEKHRNEGWHQHQQGKSRHERGYGSKWDIIRARILSRDKHICQNCLRVGAWYLQRRLTTSRQRHMAVLMMTRTSKASAGPAIAPKQGANESSNNYYHLSHPCGRGGSNLCSLPPKDRRLSQFFIPAKNEI